MIDMFIETHRLLEMHINKELTPNELIQKREHLYIIGDIIWYVVF